VKEWEKRLWHDWARPEATRERHLRESAGAAEKQERIRSQRMKRFLVDVVGEQGMSDFKDALQLRLDQGWTVVSHACSDPGADASVFWYTAVLTKTVSDEI